MIKKYDKQSRNIRFELIISFPISQKKNSKGLLRFLHTIDRGHIDQIRARVSHRLFLKSIFPKDFRNSLVILVGWRKSEPTYFNPPLIERVPPYGKKSVLFLFFYFTNVDFDSFLRCAQCPRRFFWAIKINIRKLVQNKLVRIYVILPRKQDYFWNP